MVAGILTSIGVISLVDIGFTMYNEGEIRISSVIILILVCVAIFT